MAKYKRILLKLSGESLMGEKQYGIDEKRLAEYAEQIKEIHQQGVQIGIVIGGGNIFRGLSGANKGFDRVKGDQMGMLATVINSLALSSANLYSLLPYTFYNCNRWFRACLVEIYFLYTCLLSPLFPVLL